VAKRARRKRLNRILRETYHARQQQRREAAREQLNPFRGYPNLFRGFTSPTGRTPTEYVPPLQAKPRSARGAPWFGISPEDLPRADDVKVIRDFRLQLENMSLDNPLLPSMVPDDVVVFGGDGVLLVGKGVNREALEAACKELGIEFDPKILE
jgi:hypothetical protein